MRTNIITVLCLLALRVYSYEELLPTQTLGLESRDESSCSHYNYEARVNNRRIGYLAFNGEGSATVTKDKHAASLLHTDSEGRARAGKSYIGTKSHKKYSTVKALPKKGKGGSKEIPSNMCYSKKTKMIYSGKVPERLQCSPVTVTPSCGKSRTCVLHMHEC